jgi:hypothetical protein
VTRRHKQQLCHICRKRPPWRYKNCPPGVCKRCYHKEVWPDRPAARRERRALQQWEDLEFEESLSATNGDMER